MAKSNDETTFSSAPIITHDGEDENGVRAEVKVVKGFGEVLEIETTSKGVAAKVTFKVANTKWPLVGYIPVAEKAYKIVEKANEDGTPVHFRIETIRKPNVDRSLPFNEISPPKNMEMARENTFKSLAGVRFDEDEEMTLNSKALTNPEEDPGEGGRYSAVGKSYEKSAPAVSNSSPQKSYGEPGYYTKYLENGEVNPASGEITAVISIYSFVSKYSRNLPELAGLDDGQKAYLTSKLYKVAENMQMDIWDGELDEPNAALGSGTRARQIMFEMIESFYPIDLSLFEGKKGKTYPALDKWADDVEAKGISMWKWAQKVVK